jgi:hypothetical protein
MKDFSSLAQKGALSIAVRNSTYKLILKKSYPQIPIHLSSKVVGVNSSVKP